MACEHKFKNDLKIDYAEKWSPTTLIVGTFNPQWPSGNSANWFYGRTGSNHFWDVLPRVYGQESLMCKDVADWKKFCETNKIALTDLIECITTANESEHLEIIAGYSDKAIEENFKMEELKTVNIVDDILRRYPTIKNIYLTRGASQGLWKKLWKPIVEYSKVNKDAKLRCEELLTPSGYAFYQFTKEQRRRHDSLQSFILHKWREKWHEI